MILINIYLFYFQYLFKTKYLVNIYRMYRKNSADLAENYKFNENIVVSNPKITKKRGKNSINKIIDDDFFIPEIKQYSIIMVLNYNVKQLKEICKHYKQKQGGNKNEIKNRIYTYMRETHYIKKLQRLFKNKLFEKYLKLKGCANHNRKICVNETDFISLKKISEIPHYSFYSYTHNDITYGFHIGSLKTYIDNNTNNSKEQINPYDRSSISDDNINDFYRYLKICIIFNYPLDLEIEKDDVVLNDTEIIRNKTIELFQHMDSLGHYTNPNWFINLDLRKLLRFIRELHDIWEYRAQLTIETKRNIHYPNGTPFNTFMQNSRDINHLRKTILTIIENLTTKGTTNEFKSLGTMYVLGAFTLVCPEAADALPWLYDSVFHI